MAKSMGMAALKVLRAIAAGSEYGFDIIDATRLPSGTVYPALSRHERDGYLRSSWEEAQKAQRDHRPARRYYRLTAEGRRAIETALAELGLESVRAARPARVRG